MANPEVINNLESDQSLDQFVLDEPWKPVNYLNDEDEERSAPLSDDGANGTEAKNFSNLFQLNMTSIQNDIQKVRSASIDQQDTPISAHLMYGANETDEDDLQKYISFEDTEEHLKVLDSTVTINQKSIEGDMERLRRFQLSSIDEDDKITDHIEHENIPSDSYSNMGKDDQGEKGNSDEGVVDRILDLLPDIDEILQEPDQPDPSIVQSGNDVDSSLENSNTADILDNLTFPEVPSDRFDDETSQHDLSSQQETIVNDDGIDMLNSDISDSKLTEDISGDISSALESQPGHDNEEESLHKEETTLNAERDEICKAPCESQEEFPGVNSGLVQVEASLPEVSSLSSDQCIDEDGATGEKLINAQPIEDFPEEIGKSEVEAKLEQLEGQEPLSQTAEREITSALIADLILAESNPVLESHGSTEEVGDINVLNFQSEAATGEEATIEESSQARERNTSLQHLDGQTVFVDTAVSADGSESSQNITLSGNVDSVSGSTQTTEGNDLNRGRVATGTSSGSEDLEQFIHDQYENNGATNQAVSTDARQAVNSDMNQGTSTSAMQETNPNDRRLGFVPPTWVPDKDAKVCMLCENKFTVVKRRHHCRACGKVLCASCCNMKFNLPYMSFKPARVCQVCCDTMIRAQNILPLPTDAHATSRVQTVPTIPEVYDSDGNSSPSPQSRSYLPETTESPPSYQQSTTYQGPLVGGQGTTSSGNALTQNFYPVNRNASSRMRTESEVSAVIMFNSTQTNLPPVIRENNGNKDRPPVVFLVNKNLIVRAKIVQLDCCVGKVCWCFCTDGMGASNQEEIVLVNEYYGDDVSAIKCVLQQLNSIFEKAKQGNSVGDLGCHTFNGQMLLNPNLTSMIFFKTSLQCTQNLIKPSSPFLFGQYLHANEVSWGKVFPMRVFLRLGLEYMSYPCPIYNDLNREALYSSGGRTIVNLLADLRNYQYSVQKITGVLVMLKNKDTILRLPQNRYDEVLKLVNTAEDHVLCFGGNFTTKTDSYFVAVENDNGFATQTVNLSKKSRKVTLASFVVFSASLKPTQEGIVAKTSIVEDGIMVQITSDFMKTIRSAIKDMRDHSVPCGIPDSNEGKLIIEWTTGEPSERSRHKSPIDGMTLDNLTNMKIRHSYDYSSSTNPCKIHWMEVYFLPNDGNTVDRLSARELGQMTSSVAKACMEALRPHLATLCELKMNWIGLRVSLDSDSVEYKIGSNLGTLPDELSADLDDKLIPAIHSVMSNLPQGKIQVELIFQVVRIV